MPVEWPGGLPAIEHFHEYRKRPIVIRAVQVRHMLTIPTLEGPMQAMPGDWVIIGTAGELYPCKPDIFATIYEAVS